MKNPRAQVDERGAAASPPRWRAALLRRIALTIALKLALLTALYLLFFSPSHRPPIDAGAVDRLLLQAR
ncbi:cytochrome oxidase putative small subunit CydP [Lysobacter enzymogenes]|uniref:Uncharacterized protein n=1 Tax=Lysobacter enzymogenes TaxID=69 RepID=A0A3N2RAT8_LYSEN|nr:cytochrome oxidase putative small subunit CydP [Lysobacter enzymogenes]ROU04466.1 hypothetical protein D9T17_23925 [Lysobacter enzymogenes]